MKKSLLLITIIPLLLAGCSSGETDSNGSNLPEDGVPTFNAARRSTVEAEQYEYDFAVTAKIKFKGSEKESPALYSGTTQINMNNDTTKFFQKRTLGGSLLFESTNYVYNSGNNLIKISADENSDFSVIEQEEITSSYDYDKMNFGYILKVLGENDIAKADFKDGKYDISLKTNFSQDSLLSILNVLDSNLILKALSAFTKEKWGVGFEVNTWATLDEAKAHLKVFHFDASVNIKDTFEIGFQFEQTFKKYSDVNIVLPRFANTIVDETQVKSELATLKGIYDSSKAQSSSYYTFDVKTAVDHGVSKSNPLGLAVNSRTQGKARRQIVGDKVYFANRLEVDSDYKNSDQLGDLVADYDSYRARLNDGADTVYDVLDPKIGTNKYTELTSYNESDIDEYYMMPQSSFISFDNFRVIKKSVDNKSNNVYQLGMSNDGIKELLKYYNKTFRIDFSTQSNFLTCS